MRSIRFFVLSLLLVACGKEADPPPQKGGAGEGGHVHTAKMGGVLLDLDHVIQLEFVLKEATLRVYVWDGHVERPIRVKQPTLDIVLHAGGEEFTVSCLAQANKLTGETEGDTALFQATATELRGVRSLRGVLTRLHARGQMWEELSFDLSKPTRGQTGG